MPASPPLPLAPEPALQTAARLLAEGRPDRATDLLGALLDDAPTYAAAHVLHATALEAAGRPADAREAWTRAAFLVPRSPLVLRERQRLAGLAAPPAGGATADDAPPAPYAAPPVALAPAAPHDEPPPGADALPAGDDIDAPRTMSLDELVSLDHDDDEGVDHAFEGLPLDGLAAFAETGTPFFGEDDDARAADEAEAEPPEAPPETPPEAPPEADWGDLPPIGAPILPPDAPAAPAPEPAPPAEPDDWRVIETVDAGAADDPPALAFDRSFGAPPPAAGPTGPDSDGAPHDAPRAAPPPDDLDALISSLEHAPRIRPDPAFSGPAVAVDESGVDEMVSETLAQIYAAQHRYVEAAVMYEKLAAREPDRAEAMLRRAAELRQRR